MDDFILSYAPYMLIISLIIFAALVLVYVVGYSCGWIRDVKADELEELRARVKKLEDHP